MPGPRRAFGAPCCAERSQQGAWVLRPAKGSAQGQKEKGVRSRAKGGQRSGEHEAARASLGGACAPGLLPRPSAPPLRPRCKRQGSESMAQRAGLGREARAALAGRFPAPGQAARSLRTPCTAASAHLPATPERDSGQELHREQTAGSRPPPGANGPDRGRQRTPALSAAGVGPRDA